MLRNKSIGRQQCKKHPKHRQSPGVCSLCLSDKLSKVSTAGTASRSAMIRARARVYYHSSSSSSLSSSYDSSCASSTAASPLHVAATAHHRRIVSDVRGAVNAMEENGGGSFFSKSKSMAYVGKERLVLRSDNDGVDDDKKKRMKKNHVKRLWYNLLRLGRNEQKRVNNAEDIDHRKMLMISQQHQQPYHLASSSTMFVH